MSNSNYIDRIVQNQVLKASEQEIITLILGARQVGKSTLLKYVKDHLENQTNIKRDTNVDINSANNSNNDGNTGAGGNLGTSNSNNNENNTVNLSSIDDLNSFSFTISQNVFSYNLDDVNLRGFLKKDIFHIQKDLELSLGTSFSKLDKKIYVFIDEIQKYPDLLDWVKQTFDDYSKYIKFFLTGSSSVHIKKASAETLAGRIEYVYVYPLSFSEIYFNQTKISYKFIAFLLNQIQTQIQNSNENLNSQELTLVILDTLKNYLTNVFSNIHKNSQNTETILQQSIFYGGLPRVYNCENNLKLKMVSNYIQVYLEKEIAALSKNIDLELFGLSLKAFAIKNGKKLNLVNISKDVGISRPSLYNYLELLETTFLAKKIYPIEKRGKIVTSLNLYILDTGILNNLNFINSYPELLMRENYEKTIASWILSQILTQFSLLDNPPQIYFWQDYFKHKIDFIIPTSFFDILFIVRKNLSTNKLVNTLKAFFKKHNKNCILFLPDLEKNKNLKLDMQELEFNKHKVYIFKIPLSLFG